MTHSTISLKDAKIRPKSVWQSDNCLFCKNVATIEAALKDSPIHEIAIRCCENPECIEKAKKWAVDCAQP